MRTETSSETPAGGRPRRPNRTAAAMARGVVPLIALIVAACLPPGVAGGPGAGIGERALAPSTSFRSPASAAPAVTAPASVVGRWVGSYEGRTYARAGRIVLDLRPAGATVDGVVRIGGVPTEGRPVALAASPARGERARTGEVVVQIASAEVRGDTLRLVSEAYWDAGCGCTLTLRFSGRLRGDTLSGRFRAAGAATIAPERDGRWRAARAVATR